MDQRSTEGEQKQHQTELPGLDAAPTSPHHADDWDERQPVPDLLRPDAGDGHSRASQSAKDTSHRTSAPSVTQVEPPSMSPVAATSSSSGGGPGPKHFRPDRGPHPVAFFIPTAIFAAGVGVLETGLFDPSQFALSKTLLSNVALGCAVVFGAFLSWSIGRRSRTDEEAALVFQAAGELGAPLMVTNAQGRVLYANKGFRKLFQPNGVAEIPNALRFDDTDGEAPVTVGRMLAAGAAGATDTAELGIRMAGGQMTWWDVTVCCVGRPGKGFVSWTARDVTARHELDEVRRAEESLLADLLDNLPVGFFSVDGAGRMVYANETLCKWLGIRLSDIRDHGLNFANFVIDLVPSEDERDQGENGQVTLRSRTGEEFKVFLMQSARLGDDDDLLYTRSIVVRDLVRRQPPPETAVAHPGDEDISEIARKLYWLFDEAPVAIALLDMRANITDCNGAFLKMLGLHKDDVFGRQFSERMVKEDQGEVASQLSKVMMGIMRGAHLEIRMPAAGGREVTASLFASRMEDAVGEVTGLILHFIDTTEHKHLEVQFAQSQKMQSIGQLAGGVAHDFNNLLTAMIGFSDLLLTRHGPEDPSFNDINQIRQNAVRATSLVRQLLAFSRKQTLEPQVIDAKEKLSDLTEVISRLLGPTIELNIEHSRDLGPIRVDPTQFDQVILNLAVNARDAMPGGGTLTIRTANLVLDTPSQRGMELVPAGEYVTVDVIDTGEGIRKEDISRIFEPFFSTKEVGEGTGLGLSTVYGIVHQTGGHVFVDSAPGEGAAFTICLPRFDDTIPNALATNGTAGGNAASESGGADNIVSLEQERQRNQPELKAEREDGDDTDLTGIGTILFVEDEDAVRMFGARALRNKGYTILEAGDGEEALEVINATEQSIDLIITDVVMPGMDGHTLVQFVRQEMPDMKVILISGFAENVIPGGIDENAGFSFLPKPFSLKDLAAKVKAVLAED